MRKSPIPGEPCAVKVACTVLTRGWGNGSRKRNRALPQATLARARPVLSGVRLLARPLQRFVSRHPPYAAERYRLAIL